MTDYKLIDADEHYYEPYDCYTRHIESKYRDEAVHPVVGDDGLARVYQGDRRLPWTPVWYLDYVGAPGALNDYYLGKTNDRKAMIEEGLDARDYPEFIDRAARLRLLDDQNIESTVMLPGLGLSVEHDLHTTPEVLYANMRAFNRWLDEDWGFGTDGRIYGVPYLSLVDVDSAIADLDWMLDRGARIVTLRTGPIFGKSPADPSFDPVWARLNEARVPVLFHTCDGGATYADFFATQYGERQNVPQHQYSAFQFATCKFERPIVDTVMALILHNLFGRFPGIRIMSIENGSDWVPHTLKLMDKAHHHTFGRESTYNNDRKQGYGQLDAKPSEIFREHFYINPFVEEPVQALIDLIGADHVLWGSDYPHPEGVASPPAHADGVAEEVGGDAARLVLRENTKRLLVP
jgi:predicted TIM-barrel fold metal-dependent hydrolase